MGKKPRKSKNLKTEIVIELLRGESIEILARNNQVTVSEIEVWRERFLKAGTNSLSSTPKTAEKADLEAAMRLIADQAMTIEILKKRNLAIERIKNRS
jgi:hypothetical protein